MQTIIRTLWAIFHYMGKPDPVLTPEEQAEKDRDDFENSAW